MAIDRRIREYQTTPETVSATHFLVDYRLRPEPGFSLEESTFRLLLITSVGTIKPLHYEPGFERGLIRGPVEQVGGYMLIQEHPDGSGLVTLALPLRLCSPRESLTGLFQLISGGAEYAYTSEYWIERLTLPRAFVSRYEGPRFGVQGLRNSLGVQVRPPLGIVLKPRQGVSADRLYKTAEEALIGGCDFVCDDVLLADPDGDLSLQNRAARFAELARSVTASTGEKKSYLCNVSASPQTALRNTHHCIDVGVDGIILDAFTMGLGGVEDLVGSLDDSSRIPVITTDMGVALMSRAPTRAHDKLTQTGMSEAIFARLCRLAGVDGVHTGTVGSECYGEMEWNRIRRSVEEPMADLLPCFAVAEGDLGIAGVWPNISSLGPDVLIEVTSGIINYPQGIRKGAEAFRSFIDALDPVEMNDDQATEVIDEIARKNGVIRKLLDASE